MQAIPANVVGARHGLAQKNIISYNYITALYRVQGHFKTYISMITQDSIVEQIKKVYDPEIPVNIYDLGLIYDLKIVGSEVYILMTLTTATCPAAAFIPEEVKSVVGDTPGVAAVHVDIVYEPRWSKEKMSAEAKEILGFA